MKLPSFYLLDAISKNVYDPYARHFTPIVVRLFLDTYEVVDQQTRSKMEEMLLTWRTGSPNGRELFGVVSQVAIERHIWGGESAQSTVCSPSNRLIHQPERHPPQSGGRDGGSSISQAQVLSELEFVLGQKERLLLASPHDELTKHHVSILQQVSLTFSSFPEVCSDVAKHQLRGMVQAGVPQRDLQAILTQLRALTTPSSSPPLPPAPAPPPYPAAPSYIQPPSMPAAPQPPYQSQPAYAVTYEQPLQEPVDLARLLPSAVAPIASTSSAPSVPIPDISGIFSALVRAGVVSTAGTPTGAGTTSKPEEFSESVDPERQARQAYRKSIMSVKIKLTSADVSK